MADQLHNSQRFAHDALHIVESLPDGVAVLNHSLSVEWCNPAFRRWVSIDPVGRPIRDSLPIIDSLDNEHGPIAMARAGRAGSVRLPLARDRFVELRISALGDNRLVVELHDVSHEELRQQKLDVLQHAGRSLANLDAEHLSEMSVEERIELLKHNLRQFIHDVIEIRLLNRRTGELEALIEDGVTAEAAERTLFARSEGQGVTGYVAVTGKSYLCTDATRDPLYIEGAAGAKSSMTVPLLVGDEVIGTFNIESPSPNAFTPEDLQFTEIFGREIAHALFTLELLSAQKRSTASESIAAINREIALPVDDILSTATGLILSAGDADEALAAKLRQIVGDARAIKQNIASVGVTIAPPPSHFAADPRTGPLNGLRVLVVDTDDRVRRSAHTLLDRYGCRVETARNGTEALAMAQSGEYDAILVDIRLPDLSGYEAYRRIRDLQPAARMILVTAFGYDASHSIVHARQEGLRWVLFKPFRTDQLFEALVGAAPESRATPQPALRS